jgi:hypothetical protein
MKTKIVSTTEPQHDAKPPVKRCGNCLFAQGGEQFKFSNGETNYRYKCSLISRDGNIVFLNSGGEYYRWKNQKACEHFESADKSLKKRAELDKTNFYFMCDGHFEVIP